MHPLNIMLNIMLNLFQISSFIELSGLEKNTTHSFSAPAPNTRSRSKMSMPKLRLRRHLAPDANR